MISGRFLLFLWNPVLNNLDERLNVRERVEVVEWNKERSLLSCELSVSVKENPDRKNKIK